MTMKIKRNKIEKENARKERQKSGLTKTRPAKKKKDDKNKTRIKNYQTNKNLERRQTESKVKKNGEQGRGEEINHIRTERKQTL